MIVYFVHIIRKRFTIMKKYNSFQLKLFFALLMVLDHLHHIPGFLPPWWMEIFHVLTRPVAPFFAYMAVEGFLYTRSRLKYNSRLFLWAGIMFLGNFTLNNVLNEPSLTVYNNIFFSLAMGIFALNIWCFQPKNTKINPKIILIIRVLIGVPITLFSFIAYEGSNSIVPFMFICYFFRNKIHFRNLATVILSFILFFTSIQIMPTWQTTLKLLMYNSDWLIFTAIPFIYIYNGKRGPNSKLGKYFFYVFYPAHLWIIALIGYYYIQI